MIALGIVAQEVDPVKVLIIGKIGKSLMNGVQGIKSHLSASYSHRLFRFEC